MLRLICTGSRAFELLVVAAADAHRTPTYVDVPQAVCTIDFLKEDPDLKDFLEIQDDKDWEKTKKLKKDTSIFQTFVRSIGMVNAWMILCLRVGVVHVGLTSLAAGVSLYAGGHLRTL